MDVPELDTDIAKSIRAELITQIGRERYELWFGKTVTITCVEGEVRIFSSQQFQLDQLRRRQGSEVQAACQRVLGRPVAVAFQLTEQVPPPDTRPPCRSLPATPACHGSAEEKRNSHADKPAGAIPPDGLRIHDSNRGRRFANLETFVEGTTNRLALTAARLLLEDGQQVSPLFIHGSHGLGKTHLLEGIHSAARRNSRMRRVVYLSAEQFTNHFLEGLRGSGLPNFRRRYRDLELLLIDDVQFFAGKRSTIVELQHTVDNLLREGRKVVLAADRAPQELTTLGAELVNRFSGGLVCRLEPHDFATRVGILQGMARERGFTVPPDVIDQLARELCGDARLLSGALNRLHATSVATGAPISTKLAEQSLDDLFRTAKPLVRLNDIEQAVCDVFGLEASTLQSNSRSKWISQPRMLAMWLARKYTRAPFVEIGEYFGRRSHSTVVSAQQKVDRWLNDGTPIRGAVGDWRIEEAVRRVEAKLGAG